MYRGRHRHEVTNETALDADRVDGLQEPGSGPREFFYADCFASRRTGCRSQLGLPGVRDQHAGCVAPVHGRARSCSTSCCSRCPDNDTHSHKHGSDGQVTSLVAADQQIERLMHAAGGPDAFLEDHAVIVCSDHSQSQVEDEIDLFGAFDGFSVLPASGVREGKAGSASIAICPSSRAAQVYVLDREARSSLVPRVARTMIGLEGVDLVMHLTDHPDGEAAVRSPRGELRFAPRGDLTDLRGESWSVEGDHHVLALEVRDGRVSSTRYPDALSRVWSALRCKTAGEVLARRSLDGSSWIGAGRTTSGRVARRAARAGLAWFADLVRDRPGQRGCPRAVDAARHRADGARSFRHRDLTGERDGASSVSRETVGRPWPVSRHADRAGSEGRARAAGPAACGACRARMLPVRRSDGLQAALTLLVALFAGAVAFVPRRRDEITLAALPSPS
jgi:hypothetical protein